MDTNSQKQTSPQGHYDAEQILVAGVMSEGAAVEEAIDRLFDNKIVKYLHIGDATTGCYFVKVERP